MKEFLGNVSDYAKSNSESKVRFESESALNGHQARVESEAEARMFMNKLSESKKPPVKMTRRTFLFCDVKLRWTTSRVQSDRG